jgi:hypothetical protein
MNYNAVIDVARSGFGAEVITLSEVKEHLNITFNEYDTYIIGLIKKARYWAESYTGLAIVTQTVTAALNNSLGGIYLPYSPVKDLATISDISGTAVTDPTITGITHKRLMYPQSDYVLISYTAGYGDDCPDDIKAAMLEQIAYMWNNRGDRDQYDPSALSGAGQPINSGTSKQAENKLKPYKRVTWLI